LFIYLYKEKIKIILLSTLNNKMCYTADKSIYAFIVGSILSIYLYNKDNVDLKIIGGFFFFVSFMQLFDYIFWTQKDVYINSLTTKIACIFNHLQPIVLAYLILKYKYNLDDNSKILIKLYTIFILIYTVSNWHRLNITTVTKESTPSLDWSWNHWDYAGPIYILFLITLISLFYYNIKSPHNLVASILVFISFLFSYYKYQIQKSTGRFWCYFAAYAPAIFLFLK
jgi:hypothetical protein